MQNDTLASSTSELPPNRWRVLPTSSEADEPMDSATVDSRLQQVMAKQSVQQQQQQQQQQPSPLSLILPQLPKHHQCQLHQSIFNINNMTASNANTQVHRTACDLAILPRRKLTSHQQQNSSRNRSSAISAKSKTCYLTQYKGTKSAYFNSVLVTGRLPASATTAAAARKRVQAATAAAAAASCGAGDA